MGNVKFGSAPDRPRPVSDFIWQKLHLTKSICDSQQALSAYWMTNENSTFFGKFLSYCLALADVVWNAQFHFG